MAIFIKWTDELLTHNKHIDDQHRLIIDRINLLFKASEENKEPENIIEFLNYLETHVKNHFSIEEKLQADHSFPEYGEHKKEHDEFSIEFVRLKKILEQHRGNHILLKNALTMITDWLVTHILKRDKNFSNYLSDKTK